MARRTAGFTLIELLVVIAIPARGVVTLADGSLPECQVRVVRFEPVADANGRISTRGHSRRAVRWHVPIDDIAS